MSAEAPYKVTSHMPDEREALADASGTSEPARSSVDDVFSFPRVSDTVLESKSVGTREREREKERERERERERNRERNRERERERERENERASKRDTRARMRRCQA